MKTILQARIVQIGNSRGIRIPKTLIEQLGLREQVELEVSSGQLIVRPIKEVARQGWEEQFRAMAASGDDALLDEETATSWDDEEWEW